MGTCPSKTWHEVAVEYLNHQAANLSESETTRYNLIVLGRTFDALPIDRVGTEHVEQFLATRRAEGAAPGTCNRQRATGSGLIQYAIRKGYRPAPNPFRLVPAFRESGGRSPYYTEEQMQRLIDRAAPHLQPIIFAALLTMGRRRELLTLKWCDVSLEHGFIRFRRENTKSKKERLVPVHPALAEVLRLLGPQGPDEYVFTWNGQPVRTVTTAFRRARLKAGIPELHFHDLRHVGACWGLENGLRLEELRQILGHSCYSLVLRYSRFSQSHMLGLAERLGPPSLRGSNH